MKSYWANTFYIILLASLGYFATDIYLPSLPSLKAYFQTGEAEVQLTLVVYLLSFSFTPLIFGPLSDHYGRKKVIVAGLITALLATFGSIFAWNIFALLFFRFVQGAGAGAVVIAARAMVPDLYHGKEFAKQMSYMTACMPLILTFAPMIGGYLQEYFGWRSVFIFLFFYILSILAVTTRREESLKNPRERTAKESLLIYRKLLKNRGFVLYGVGMTLPSVALFGYMTASPFIFQELVGLSPLEYGFLAIYTGIAITVASALNSRLLHYFSVSTLIRLGFGFVILSSLALYLVHFLGTLSQWPVLGAILIFFFCIPFCLSNSASKAIGQIKENFGSANALLASGQFLFGSLGSFIFSIIPESSLLPLATCIGVVGVINMFFLSLAVRYDPSV